MNIDVMCTGERHYRLHSLTSCCSNAHCPFAYNLTFTMPGPNAADSRDARPMLWLQISEECKDRTEYDYLIAGPVLAEGCT